MSEQNQHLTNQHHLPRVLSSFKTNDEIDLRELFKALWDEKLIIVITTILFAIVAVGYALSKPNIYQSSATLKIYADPYGFAEDNGYSVGLRIVHESNNSFPVLNSEELRNTILGLADDTSVSLTGVSLSLDTSSGFVTVSKQSTDPEDAWRSVKLYTDNVNKAYKASELQNAEIAAQSSKSLLNVQTGKVFESLSVRYANQLYKLAILENPDSVLIQTVFPPMKPTSHIKPKRVLIVVLGTLLGGMLGVAIVLIRFAFRREEG